MNQSSQGRVIALSLAMFGVYGVALTITGTLLPLLIDHFHLTYGQAGTLAVSVQIGYLASVVATGWLAERFAGRTILLAALAVSAIGYGGFAMTGSYWGACAYMIIGGAGGGAIEVVVNVVIMKVSEHRRGNLLNFVHVFFGLGAFVGPAVIGEMIGLGIGWYWCYLGTAILWVVLLALTTRTGLPDIRSDKEDSAGNEPVLRLPVAVLLCAVMTIYVGLELGVGGWITTYLRDVEGIPTSRGAYVASAFWLGIAGGRLFLGVIGHRWHESNVVPVLACWAIVCLAGAILLPGPWGAAAALALVGTGYSGIYPTVVSWGGGVYPKRAAQVTALIATGGGVGAVVFPWAMGYISDGFGLVVGMSFYLALAVVMLLFILRARSRTAVVVGSVSPASGSSPVQGA